MIPFKILEVIYEESESMDVGLTGSGGCFFRLFGKQDQNQERGGTYPLSIVNHYKTDGGYSGAEYPDKGMESYYGGYQK
jgi:hypothetical protein